MKTLMSPDTFAELREIRRAYCNDFPARDMPSHPFIPVFEASEEDLPRFLVIGQATRGWGNPEDRNYDFDASARDAYKVLVKRDTKAFWTFTRKFLTGTLDRLACSYDQEMIYKCMAWSNLAKIGLPAGNPKGALLTRQAALCVQQLRQELNDYQPHVILLATGLYAHKEILDEAFGNVWQRHQYCDHTEYLRVDLDNGGDVLAIWTRHPRVLGSRHPPVLDAITKMAAEAVAGRLLAWRP